MSRLQWLGVFALALMGWLLALAPLGLGLRLAGAAQTGLAAEQAVGTIWSGELRRAHFGATPLGTVKLGLQPLSVLSGSPQLSLDLRTRGASLEGAVALGALRGVSNFSVDGPLDALPLRTPAALRASVRLSDATLLFQGPACKRASGRLLLEAQVTTGAGAWAAPPLAGQWRCEAGAAVAALAGEADGTTVSMLVRVQGDGRYGFETKVNAVDPKVLAGLLAAGFAPGPDGYVRLDEGTLQ